MLKYTVLKYSHKGAKFVHNGTFFPTASCFPIQYVALYCINCMNAFSLKVYLMNSSIERWDIRRILQSQMAVKSWEDLDIPLPKNKASPLIWILYFLSLCAQNKTMKPPAL